MTERRHPGITLARSFLLVLVTASTVALLWLVAPFSGAILWAVIVAILFAPLNARLLSMMPGHRNCAAAATLFVIIAVVVVPAILLGVTLVQEMANIYARMQSGQIDLGHLLSQGQASLPDWVKRWLAAIGLSEFDYLRAKLDQGFASIFRAASSWVLSIGLGAFEFVLALGVTLYLTFFMLRDGHAVARRIERALPLPHDQSAMLVAKFAEVIRATLKGGGIVAVIQGFTGGLVFWGIGIPGALLWGATMGMFSLLPAIGTGLVWVPVTLYLLVSGSISQAVELGACGLFIISSIDNVIRPALVGHDAHMPDYVVLVTTLGGFELVGFNGFIIGPAIAALFITTWEIFGYAQQRDTENQHFDGPTKTLPSDDHKAISATR